MIELSSLDIAKNGVNLLKLRRIQHLGADAHLFYKKTRQFHVPVTPQLSYFKFMDLIAENHLRFKHLHNKKLLVLCQVIVIYCLHVGNEIRLFQQKHHQVRHEFVCVVLL